MSLDAIVGQDLAVAALRRMIAAGRVPSALLFLGPENVGKTATALALAAALNCRERPGAGCGRCPPCRKIAAGVHADVEVVSPSGQFIRIDQVRQIAERVSLIPFEAAKRVIVLTEAERMNPAAANAFLKTLEEPPADTLLVLCAAAAGRLPETIVSRCMPLRFSLLAEAEVRRLLGGEGGLSGAALEVAARLARGRARPELRDGRWQVLRDEVLEVWHDPGRAAYARLTELAGRWGGGEEWRFVLEWLETWYRDLALLGGGGAAERLINRDVEPALRESSRALPPRAAERAHAQVLATRAALLLSVNKALALEALWLRCRAIARPSRAGRAA